MIHICYALRDQSKRYSKFAGTMMLSIFEHTHEPVTIHVIHDSTLSRENQRKLTLIAYQYDQEIIFYDVDKVAKNFIDDINSRSAEIHEYWGSIAVFYRLLLPEILPREVSKVIVLDTDLIFNLDIAEIWQTDLGEKWIAAVPEFASGIPINLAMRILRPCATRIVAPEDYFNAGVFILDLDKFRKNSGGGGAKSWIAVFRSRCSQYHFQQKLFETSAAIQSHFSLFQSSRD